MQRVLSGLVAALLLLATAVVVAPVAQAASADRISGADRYATSAAIAARFDPTPTVWVASGADFPDALSAAPAAVAQGGPLLLTAPGSLSAAVKTQLSRLRPATIVVAGGTGAVSVSVAKELSAFTTSKSASSVVRMAGADRYATSRAIADYAFGTTPTAYVTSGEGWADALSAGAGPTRAQFLSFILTYPDGATIITGKRSKCAP
ncbi:cell wall-binding repeat-containing protein [Leifsonia sp. NPDC080035]|uniref:Cell wall-binding repeat-containing protein n=1 Tax=Leifsonia sp. NPDC080035 TaxID=3143936 RepID=A0AAU7GEP1_9MICO